MIGERVTFIHLLNDSTNPYHEEANDVVVIEVDTPDENGQMIFTWKASGRDIDMIFHVSHNSFPAYAVIQQRIARVMKFGEYMTPAEFCEKLEKVGFENQTPYQ